MRETTSHSKSVKHSDLTMHVAYSRTIILSVQPQWVELLHQGRKTLEFRRKWPINPTPHKAAIYASSPVCAIVAIAIISKIHVATPEVLMSLSRSRDDAENYEQLASYLFGLSRAAALEICKYQPIANPITLPHLRRLGFRPPQNFTYLDQHPQLQAELLSVANVE